MMMPVVRGRDSKVVRVAPLALLCMLGTAMIYSSNLELHCI